MSTEPLTRDEACDRFVAEKRRDINLDDDLDVAIARLGFLAGWSARDAELARLTAEVEKLLQIIEYTAHWLNSGLPYSWTDNCWQKSRELINAALAHKEPSDAK